MYNPELVVLGGGVGSHPALCSATIQYLQDNDFALPLLRSSSLGTRAQLFGAVSVSLAAAEQKLLC
jgi:glucokinase